MARQVEGSLPAEERTDELPVLSADAARSLGAGGAHRADTADALDRSLEALRETLERAEARWRQLESQLANQDRAIRELKDELRRAKSDRFAVTDLRASRVPELTEIVMSAARTPTPGDPSAGDTSP